MHPKALISRIESTAPLHLAASWDKSGVQIASESDEIKTLCVALDPSVDTVRRAVDLHADFLLCHHPLTLSPRLPSRLDDFHEILTLSLGKGLWIYSAHTSLDANPAGPVNWLGRALDLKDRRILEVTSRETPVMFRLHGPEAAERVSDYGSSCIRRENGQTEFVIWPEHVRAFRASLGTDASYEEIPLASPFREFGFGCIGTLPNPMSWPDFLASLKPLLGARHRLVGSIPDSVTTVAYCPGSGADLGLAAFQQGADVFLTGDVKYHQAQAVQDQGVTIDVGHFSLEEAMMRIWSESLTQELASSGVRVVFLPGRDPFI